MAADPKAPTRTWQDVFEEIIKLKHGETQRRWRIAAKDKALPEILNRPLIETRAEHLLRAMEIGKVSTNVYLRRIHNFALAMSWLPAPIIPKRQWPTIRHRLIRIALDVVSRTILGRVAEAFRPDETGFSVQSPRSGRGLVVQICPGPNVSASRGSATSSEWRAARTNDDNASLPTAVRRAPVRAGTGGGCR